MDECGLYPHLNTSLAGSAPLGLPLVSPNVGANGLGIGFLLTIHYGQDTVPRP